MNLDDIKQRYEPRDAKAFNKNNSALRAELEQQTIEYLKKGKEIHPCPSCVSSEMTDFKTHMSQEATSGLLNKTSK